MSLQRSPFFFLAAFLLTLDNVSGYDVKQIVATGYWKKIFQEENNSPASISFTRTWTSGLRTLESNEQTVIAKHTVGGGISSGDSMKLLSININYSYEHSTTSRNLRETEIHRSREQTTTFTVPPWTKLARWQFVANIGGVEYDSDYTLTTTNDAETPTTLMVIATVQLRKKIRFGTSWIRIRHKIDGRYLTAVSRYNWQGLTLGRSNLFYFSFHYSDHDYYRTRGIVINSHNTTHAGYERLYGSHHGGIYLDYKRDWGTSYNAKQYWYLNKFEPLFDGDVVTFRNNYYDDSFLCHYPETWSWVNVYCIQSREDDWILEVL